MANPIFHSAYTAQQIEDEITNGVPKVVNGYWYRWDIATSAWADTGVKSGVEPPYVVTLAADMTDTGLTYIYIGSEAGYTFGHWYYWDGVQWADGGAFLAAPADSELSYTSANAIQNKIVTHVVLNAYPTATIEDATIASFSDGADGIPVKTMTVDVNPVQAAGTPSPDNPLTISGWTGANIVVSPTQDAGDGTTYTVNWQTEAGTVYGGTLTDNGDGSWTLIQRMVGVDMGALTWVLDTSAGVFNRFYATASNLGVFNDCICEVLATAESAVGLEQTDNSIKLAPASNRIIARADAYATAAAFKAAVTGHLFVYGLATPRPPITISSESVRTMLGDNNIWSDTGNIAELTYRADPTLYISGKINAIMAAIAEI